MSTPAITPFLPKWRGSLTDRARFQRQMHRQPVDRCFNMEFGYWDDNFKLWPMFRDHGITNNNDADIFLNFDRTAVVGSHWMHPTFPYEEISRTATTRVLRNGDGLIAEVPMDGHDTIPHFLDSSVKTPDDWKRVKEERFDRRHPDRKADIAAILRDHPANRDYPLGVWCGSMIGKVRDMLTVEGLAYAVFDYPRWSRTSSRRPASWWKTSSMPCCRTSRSTTPPAGRTSATRAGRSSPWASSATSSCRATSASARSSARTAWTSGGSTATATSAR